MKNYLFALILLAISSALWAQDDINLLDLVKSQPADSVRVIETSASESVASQPLPLEYDWRDHRHSLSLSVGSPSLFSGTVGILTAIFDAFDHTADSRHIKIFGSYGIHYGYNALSWLRVGGSFVYCGWKKIETGSGNYYHKESYNEFSFMGKVDFTYLNRQHVRLYSGVGIGAILTMSDTYGYVSNFAPNSERTYFPNLGWTITPIGLEAGGKHVYGLAEINIGTADLLRAGIGVRF